ncbi:MAG: ABC transporter ATP-binding protein [Defluviitaleaceae bacterium]|nr:ABC transporter ATP-binding protein [Defluviitaleaceae bacterium]
MRNLTKIYGQHKAIDQINFTVDDGEIVGFLGPNGAGKTTTMNIMTGFIAATSGDVSIGGLDIVSDAEKAKAQIGYLPDTPPVYGDMRVDEYLNFVADIKGVKRGVRKNMLADIKRQVRIEDMSRRLIKNLSRGYKQRVGLAQAMVGYPKVIIMDEPTIGLDPKQIIEMRDVIKGLGNKQTVILSSHILQEVSAVCDRVMIINRGKIVASDTPEKLSATLNRGNNRMQVTVKAEKQPILKALADFPIIRNVDAKIGREPGTTDLILSGERDDTDIREFIFKCMAKNNLPILLMKSTELTLEEIFLTLTGDTRSSPTGYVQSITTGSGHLDAEEPLQISNDTIVPEALQDTDISNNSETSARLPQDTDITNTGETPQETDIPIASEPRKENDIPNTGETPQETSIWSNIPDPFSKDQSGGETQQ